ncbi:MAG: hypothetical protein FWG64_11005 [Firmicutes bacterium]|nr:hypothetical protein [Bacillota bacterium]
MGLLGSLVGAIAGELLKDTKVGDVLRSEQAKFEDKAEATLDDYERRLQNNEGRSMSAEQHAKHERAKESLSNARENFESKRS